MKIEEWFKIDSEITHMIVVLGNNNLENDMFSLDELHSKLFLRFNEYELDEVNLALEYYRKKTKDIDPVRL